MGLLGQTGRDHMTDIFAGLICRPPRKQYAEADLGPPHYMLGEQMCMRRDFDLVTRRRMKVKASLYLPVNSTTLEVDRPVPCVVYLHGNSGSRLDADDMVDTFLTAKIAVLSIDFAGCGLSDGSFVTLGWREREDLEAALAYLSSVPNMVSHVALYGRSMGAATAMLVAADDRFRHHIVGMVVDSCYTSVRQVLLELAKKYVGTVPLVPFSGMIEPAVEMLRQAVMQRAEFDIDKIDVLEAARHCDVPVLFGHAADDQLVLASHSQELFKEYGGKKEINVFEGDHNSIRPTEFRDQALSFLQTLFADAVLYQGPQGPSFCKHPLAHQEATGGEAHVDDDGGLDSARSMMNVDDDGGCDSASDPPPMPMGEAPGHNNSKPPTGIAALFGFLSSSSHVPAERLTSASPPPAGADGGRAFSLELTANEFASAPHRSPPAHAMAGMDTAQSRVRLGIGEAVELISSTPGPCSTPVPSQRQSHSMAETPCISRAVVRAQEIQYTEQQRGAGLGETRAPTMSSPTNHAGGGGIERKEHESQPPLRSQPSVLSSSSTSGKARSSDSLHEPTEDLSYVAHLNPIP